MSREKHLPEFFRDAGFRIGVEVGVECGLYSEHLCQHIPGLTLYSVDCWQPYKGYRDHVNKEKLEGFYEEAKKRLEPYNCTLIREWSVEAAKLFGNQSVDFVYIDGNHDYANVVKDIDAWAPKVRKGGIVSGHDFIKRKREVMHHVVEAVAGWADCYQISPWFILGRKDVIPGEPRDHNRSWMWVK